MVKKFICNKCKGLFSVKKKAYWETHNVCQKCFDKLKMARKSKSYKEK